MAEIKISDLTPATIPLVTASYLLISEPVGGDVYQSRKALIGDLKFTLGSTTISIGDTATTVSNLTLSGNTIIASPFTLGATSVTTTGARLNYLTSAGGTTGTTTTNLVFSTSPTLVTPVLGVATATSINKVIITPPATSSTLTIANGKILTVSNTITLTGIDSSTLNIGAGGTLGSNAFTSGAFAPLDSPVFTGVVTIPTPFTLGAISVTTTGTELNYLNAANGTTGTNNLVFSTSPTLVTPNIGVATATSINKVIITAPATTATLTISTGKTLTIGNTLTITGVDGSTYNLENIGAGGFAPINSPTFTGTVTMPSPFTLGGTSVTSNATELNYLNTATGTTGTGEIVFSTSPTLITPVLGVATATSINKVTITAPATSATLTIANGKTLTVSNTLTFTGTDSSTLNIGAGGTLGPNAYSSTAFAPLASPTFTGVVTIPSPFTLGATSVTTTGARLNYLTSASGTTGTISSNLVFSTSPILVTPTLGAATATSINKVTITEPATSATLTIADGKALTVNNTLIFEGTDGSLIDFDVLLGVGGGGGYAPIASPTFTGTVTIPTPFTLGATSVTTTGTRLNYLTSAGGTTGTTTSNIVFSASPTFTGTVTIPSPFTLGATSVTATATQLNLLTTASGTTGTTNLVLSNGPSLNIPTLASPTFTGTTSFPNGVITSVGNVGIGVTPLHRLHIKDTAADVGIRIDAYRTGANYYNSFIQLNAPRSDTVDGGTSTGRSFIVTPGQSGTNVSSIFMGANTASGVMSGDPDAIRANQGLIEVTSSGTLDLWRQGVSIFHVDNAKTVVGADTGPTLGGFTPAFSVAYLSSGVMGISRFVASTAAPALYFGKSRGTMAAAAPVISGDNLALISFCGDDGALPNGAIPIVSSQIRSYVDGTVSTGIVPASFSFHTMNAAGTFNVRVTFSAEGGVSIGSTAEAGAQNLLVNGTTAAGGKITSVVAAGASNRTSITALTDAQLTLRRTVTTPAINDLGAMIGFVGETQNQLAAGIALKHTTADIDQAGLAFLVHPLATTSSTLSEAMVIDHNSNLTVAGSINKVTITPPATGATLTIADGKTLTANNTLTLTGTDGSTLNIGAGGSLTGFAPLASPVFTGVVTFPTPFTLGAISVTSTGTQLNYLNAATGTTGTTSTNLVFSTSPVLVTPTLGVATATSINKVAITAPTTSATLTIANLKTLTVNNTLTFAGTDGSTLNIGAGGTLGANAFTSGAFAPLASPVFTGVVTIPTPFTLGAISVTSTGTQLNYLSTATGTTGTTTSNLVFSATPTISNATFTGNTTFPNGVWSSTGDVGIGFVTTPAERLHVKDTIADVGIRIDAHRAGALYCNSFIELNTPRMGSADGATLAGRAFIVSPGQSGTIQSHIFMGANTDSAVTTGDNVAIRDNSHGVIEVSSAGTFSLWRLGALVFGIDNLGVVTAGPINKVTITAPVSSATLTIANTKILTVNNSLTFAGTDTSTLNIGTGGTLGSNAYTSTTYAPLASPTFTGTVIIPTPFTLGATSVTTSGTQLNYLNAATGTTGTTSTNLVFSTSPVLVTPTLGVATATSINKVTITAPATNATLTIVNTKVFTVSNTLTLAGTDGSTLNVGAGGTLGSNAFLSTTFAPLISPTFTGTVTMPTPFTLGAISVTSTGTQLNYLSAATGTTGNTSTNLVFSSSPVLVTPTLGVATATSINKVAITAPTTSATLTIANLKTLTVSNTLTFAGTDGSTLNIGAGGTLGSNAYTSVSYAPLASPTFTGTVIIPTPFTLGATSVTSTGTQLNYLSSASGTTGTTSSNLVFSTTPTISAATLTGNTNFPSGIWNSTGNVGIGTTSPAQRLHLSTMTADTGLRIDAYRDGALYYNSFIQFSAPRLDTLDGNTIVSRGFIVVPGQSLINGTSIFLGCSTGIGTVTGNNDAIRGNSGVLELNNGAGFELWKAGVSNFKIDSSGNAIFTGTVTIPSLILSATLVTSTGTQLNYLDAATGTTGTTTTNLVFSTSPTLVTPTLGVATATSINKVTITAPATNATLTIVNTKVFTVSNTLTLAGTDGSTLNVGAGGTLGSNAFLSTAFAPLASPSFTTPTLGVATATSINKVAITAPATSATLTIANGKTLTVNNTLTFTGTDGSTLNVGAGGTLGSNAYTSTAYAPLASPTFTGVVTYPTPFTLGATSVTTTGTQLNYLNAATGTTGTTTSNLVFSADPSLSYATLVGNVYFNSGIWSNIGNLSIGTVAPASNRVHIVHTTADSGIRIDAHRAGLSYYNSYITFGVPRNDTLDGNTVAGRGYIVVPGQVDTVNASIFMGAASAGGTVSGNYEAIRSNGGVLEVTNTGTLELWQNGTSLFRINTLGDLLVTGNITGAGAVNKVVITQPATNATLTIANTKVFTVSNTLTLAGTDGSTLNVGAGGTLGSNAYTSTTYAPLASPTFTGVVTYPTPFTLGATSVTTTGTQLNYLNAATGTTGTTSTNLVFSTSPTLVTPILGVATATSINKVAITAPATSATLTIVNLKTLTVNNTLTLAGTDASTLNIGAGGTLGSNAFLSTVFAPLASPIFTGVVTIPTPFTLGAISVTSTGTQLNYLTAATGTTGTTSTNLVFSTSPVLVTPTLGVATATSINKVTITAPATSATLTIVNTKVFTVSNTLTFTGTDGSTLNVGAGGTLGSNAYTSTTYAPLASPTFTGTVIIPTPFTLGATSVTSTGTQLNYLNAATGTTGTTSTNIVFSTSPTISSATFTGNTNFPSGIWNSTGNVGIGTTSPATRLHLSTTTAETGLRIDAYRAGALYYNSFIQFSSPRQDTLDGDTIVGRGFIVVPGNATGTSTSIFIGASVVPTVATGDADAIRALAFGSVMEFNNGGRFEIWRAGVSQFSIDSSGNITSAAINKITITPPATGATLTIADGKTLTANNTLTFTGTDGSTLNVGAGGTLGSNAYTSTAFAPLASPTFTGVVTIPTPFTLGAISVTSTGTQLNYLSAATGTTGTTTSNLVFSASPTFTGTVTYPTPFTLGAISVTTTGTQLNYLNAATGTTGTTTSNLVFSSFPAFGGIASATPDVLITDADTVNTRAALQIKGGSAVETAFFAGSGNTGLGTVNPVQKLHISTTTGDTGLRIDAYRSGANYYNAFIGLGAPRLDSADGATIAHHGYIVAPGNPVVNTGCIFMGAGSAGGTVTGADTALRGNQGAIEVTSAGTLDLWQTNVSRLRVDNAKVVLGGVNTGAAVLPTIGAQTPTVGIGFATASFAMPQFSANTIPARLLMGKSRGTMATPAAVAASDQIADFIFAGDDASAAGTIPIIAARMFVTVSGTVSTGIVPARMEFQTRNAAGTIATRMAIGAEGGLSVGSNTDPGLGSISATWISGAGNRTAITSINDCSLYLRRSVTTPAAGDYGALLGFATEVAATSNLGAGIAYKYAGTDADHGGLAFLVHSTTTTDSTLLEAGVIKQNGYWGIGNGVDPQRPLHVVNTVPAVRLTDSDAGADLDGSWEFRCAYDTGTFASSFDILTLGGGMGGGGIALRLEKDAADVGRMGLMRNLASPTAIIISGGNLGTAASDGYRFEINNTTDSTFSTFHAATLPTFVAHADQRAYRVSNNGTDAFAVTYGGKVSYTGDLTQQGANGQAVAQSQLTQLVTIAAAATTTTTIQIPANALVIGVSVRVTVAIPTAATFDVGVSGATTRYATALSTVIDTTSPGTIDGVRAYPAATAITITPNLTPATTVGRVRVTIHYVAITPPTS